jgi:signal transduction histidine kinase
MEWWIAEAPDERWARALYCLRRSPQGKLDALQYDTRQHRFLPAGPRPELDVLALRLDGAPSGLRPAGIIDAGALFLAAPAMPALRIPIEEQDWLVVEINVQHLKDAVLPDLWQRHFAGRGFEGEVRRTAGGEPLFRSGVALDGPPDLAVGLFEIRPERMAQPGPPPGVRPRVALDGGGRPRWELRLRHREGSLQAAVDSLRRRNLALGAGVLLLLGAAMGLLAVAARRAQLLADAQLEFAAGVSHELRTPLSVISSAGDNLADGLVTDAAQVRKYGALVRAESKRLAALVDDVLTFTGTRLGKAAVELRPQPLSPIIEKGLAACAWEVEQNGCTLERDLAPDLPEIRADARLLAHAFRNLVSNAAHHGREGKWVLVRGRMEGTKVRVEVADKGPGIEDADRARIFEPFYRGRRARDGQVRGTGLGLSLVKRIVEAHGGSVRLDSAAGEGARFVVELPSTRTE